MAYACVYHLYNMRSRCCCSWWLQSAVCLLVFKCRHGEYSQLQTLSAAETGGDLATTPYVPGSPSSSSRGNAVAAAASDTARPTCDKPTDVMSSSAADRQSFVSSLRTASCSALWGLWFAYELRLQHWLIDWLIDWMGEWMVSVVIRLLQWTTVVMFAALWNASKKVYIKRSIYDNRKDMV